MSFTPYRWEWLDNWKPDSVGKWHTKVAWWLTKVSSVLFNPVAGWMHSTIRDDQLWGSGRGHCWPLRVPLRGAIVVCYGWGGGWRPTLGGAIAGCHCSALWLGGGWRPTLGECTWCAIAGCHCRREENSGVKKSCLELLADAASSSTLIT